MNELDKLHFFNFQCQPLLVHLYLEAKLSVPDKFDCKIEGPRLVAAFREQGFSFHFIEAEPEPKSNVREKL